MSKRIYYKLQKQSKYDFGYDEKDIQLGHHEKRQDNDDDFGQNILENFHNNAGNFNNDAENFADYSSYSSDEYSSDEYSPDEFHIEINEKSFQQPKEILKTDHLMNVPTYNKRRYTKHGNNHNHHNHNRHHQHRHHHHHHQRAMLSPGDQYRKKIADENRKIVRKHPELIDWNGIKTIGFDYHFKIPKDINRRCSIRVFDCPTITAAIECHSAHPEARICLLNFANPIKPGGGYLEGHEGQEGSLCRQTLLYPTLQKSYMYYENKQRGSKPEASDIMVYSPNVLVIRNEKYEMVNNFPVDIISASAVDNRKYHIANSEEIMENRIRKIILTAISEKVEVLILGAFGCGIFKNNATTTARIFHKILVEENYKKFFFLVLFPIYNDPNIYYIFNSILGNK